MSDLVIGRGHAIDELLSNLSTDRPRVVLVTGPEGAGKGIVARQAAKCARDSGWTTIPVDPDRIVVGPTTRGTEFDAQLLAAVVAALGVDAPRQGEDGDTLETVLRSVVRTTPLWVTIGHFAPSEQIIEHLTLHVVPALRRHGERLVLVLVDRLSSLGDTSGWADAVIRVSHVDRREIDDYLRGLALDPPLSREEILTYSDVLCREPWLIDDMVRLLDCLKT